MTSGNQKEEKKEKELSLIHVCDANTRLEAFWEVVDKCVKKKDKKKDPLCIDLPQVDATLINATNEAFGGKDKITQHDVVLMAFGLLQGYEYTKIPTKSARQRDFLLYSDYLIRMNKDNNGSEDYANADKQDRERLEDNLRKMGEKWIKEVENYLTERKDIGAYIDESQNKIETDNKGEVIYPKPLYPKCEGIELNSIGGISIELKEVKRYLYKLCEKAGILKPSKKGMKEKITKGMKIAATVTTMVIVIGVISFGTFWVGKQSGSDTSHDSQDSTPIAKVPTSHMKDDDDNESTTGDSWVNVRNLKTNEIFDNTDQLAQGRLTTNEGGLEKY